MEKQFDNVGTIKWETRSGTEIVLRNWLGRQLGAREAKLLSFDKPSDNGGSAQTYRLEIEWSDGTATRRDRFIVRQEPSENANFYKGNITRWARAQQILGAQRSLPVPRVYFIEEDTTLLGGPFFAMQWIEGRIPSDRPNYRLSGWVTELSVERRRQLWTSAIQRLADIHRFDWRGAGLDFLRRGTGDTELVAEIDYFVEFSDWAFGERLPIIERTQTWLKGNIPQPERLRLCWGDVRPSNFVFSEGGLVGALDWELMSIGDPAKDLAWWVFGEEWFTQSLNIPLLPGCIAGAELIAAYEEASGERLVNYEYYRLFNLLRATAIIGRSLAVMERQGSALPAGLSSRVNPAILSLERVLEAVL